MSKLVKVIIWQFCQLKQDSWLFEKDLVLPFVPFPGLVIVDVDGCGEEYCVKKVQYWVPTGVIRVQLKTAKWSNDFPHKMMPEEEYKLHGWRCVDKDVSVSLSQTTA